LYSLKQEVAAQQVGMSDATLRGMETGALRLSLEYLDKVCPVYQLNSSLVLAEAASALYDFHLKKLARDPSEQIVGRLEQVLEAVDARHQAERKEAEAKLLWDGHLLLCTKKKFVIQDDGPAEEEGDKEEASS
jgi:hypothetical protein